VVFLGQLFNLNSFNFWRRAQKYLFLIDSAIDFWKIF